MAGNAVPKNTITGLDVPIETEEAEDPARTELFELILAYLPPIANSEGYECRGTVAEQLTDVLMEENYRKMTEDKEN